MHKVLAPEGLRLAPQVLERHLQGRGVLQPRLSMKHRRAPREKFP